MTDYSRNENVGTGERIIGAMMRNPEGLLLLAAGAALMMRRGISSSNKTRGHNQFRPTESQGDHTRSGTTVRNLGDRAADAAHSASDYASDVVEKVSQAASSYASTASDYADQATDRSLKMAREAQSSLQSTAQHIVEEQPLAVVLAGLAAGAAVAAAFPATNVERRALGPTGERMKDAAGKVGEHLKEAGAQAGRSLMDAAEERGLNREGIAQVTREAGDAFSDALTGERTGQTQNASPSPKQAKYRTPEQTSGSHNARSGSSGNSNPRDKRGPR